METRQLDRVRFVTRNFNQLQGLRYLVPLGLMVLGGAAATWAASWLLALLPAALFLGALVLLVGAEGYYRNHFGEVERPEARTVLHVSPVSILSYSVPEPQQRPAVPVLPRFLLVTCLAMVVFLLFQFLFWPPWVQMRSDLIWTGPSPNAMRIFVGQATYALCGSLLLGIWWLRERSVSQSYHFGMGVLLSGLSLLAPRFVPAATDLWPALLLSGSALVLAGLLDHWQLVRVMGRPISEEQ